MKRVNKFRNSLRFQTWFYFVLFATSILVLLQFFLFILIEPFYRETIEEDLIQLNTEISTIYFSDAEDYERTSSIYSTTYTNKACIVIISRENGVSIGFDGTGGECAIVNASGEINEELVSQLEDSEESSIVIETTLAANAEKEIMIYGQKVVHEEVEYLFFVNLPLQSLNYLTDTLRGQFTLISAVVLILAIIISFIFSSIISKPIVSMTKEAEKLTVGNYDLHFDNVRINEYRQLAETIDLAADEMQKVDDLRNELMANVTHDIKTPLTMIKAYAEMIKDISGNNEEKRNEHLDIIIQETDSLSKLVNDMLDFTRLEAGVVNLDMQAFDLSKEINKAANRFQTIAQQENVTIDLQCETELLAYGDPNRINEVVYNYISNALKHYGDDRKIIIQAFKVNQQWIRVEVIDHGPGISEENLRYIWDRYFKIDRQYHRSQTGTGLGLPISKAILEAHNAKYGVTSKLNEGSTFYFELQAYKQD